MKRYEYIRLYFDPGDLSKLNALSGDGWKVVSVMDRTGWWVHPWGQPVDEFERLMALLERELPR